MLNIVIQLLKLSFSYLFITGTQSSHAKLCGRHEKHNVTIFSQCEGRCVLQLSETILLGNADNYFSAQPPICSLVLSHR